MLAVVANQAESREEVGTELDYTQKIKIQSAIIENAIAFLAGRCDFANQNDKVGFNATDASFGHQLNGKLSYAKLSPQEEYKAWLMLKKYWRQLKQADPPIVLPKKWLNLYNLDSYLISNLSKGTGPYELAWVGEGELSCTCEAYLCGNRCGHVRYAEPILLNEQVDQDMQATADLVEELAQVDRALALIEPKPKLEPAPAAVEPAKEEMFQGHAGSEILPGIIATPGQAKALGELMDFANGGASIHLLTGRAGTGKTTLVQALIKKLRAAGDNRRIVFTAPTNKATQVLRRMVERWGLGIECVTCAKLLGLKPQINFETGQEFFVKAYQEESKAQDYGLIVVDESSMVNADLWEFISEEANFFTKILFMGDAAQLPPVNEAISKAFTEIESQSNLTEVKRYSGAIAVLADDICTHLYRRGEPCITSDYSSDGKGVFVLAKDKWNAYIVKAFQSESYLKNPDYCRVLAWTNDRVDQINSMVRSAIRGKNAPRFCIGERLIAKQHFSSDEGITLFNTSSEMEVLEVIEGKSEKHEVYFLKVQLFDDGGQTIMIPVLHDASLAKFKAEQADLAKRAKAGERNLWDLWHWNNKRFAQIDYAYATTVHKSQGSTFNHAFVDIQNIFKNKTQNTLELPGMPKQVVYERNQLLYVAITRASDRVLVFE